MCTCVHKNERCVVDVQDTRYEEALGIRRAKSYAHPAPKRRERLHKAMEKQTKVVAPQRAPLLYWRNPRGGKDNREGEEYHAEKKNSLNYIIKNQPLDRAVWFWFGLGWVGFGWCLSVPVWSCRLVFGSVGLGWDGADRGRRTLSARTVVSASEPKNVYTIAGGVPP